MCALYDVGPDFLVMELIDRETLVDRIRAGPLRLEAVLRYGGEIAEALAAAHAAGIVHRELKPGNVMIGSDGVNGFVALGLVLYEAVAGSLPFPGASLGGPRWAPRTAATSRSSPACPTSRRFS